MTLVTRTARQLRFVVVLALATACTSTGGPVPATPGSGTVAPSASAAGILTVYSGRSEDLVSGVIEDFEQASGIDVQVRYGDSAELAATILEEGEASPADVFLSQDAGALGALAEAGRLGQIEPTLMERVAPEYRSEKGEWVGVTGRARVLAFDPRVVAESDLPASVTALTDPRWKDRIGWAPTNASFQAFVTAFRRLEGEDVARAWLEDMMANGVRAYESNGPIVLAIDAGEIEAGLVNHYYVLEEEAEVGRDLDVSTHFFSGGDPGSLVNVAGVAVLQGAENRAAADRFVDYLLSQDAQTFFATQTFEYPLISGVSADERLVPLAEIDAPAIDLSALADLEATLTLLRDVGIL